MQDDQQALRDQLNDATDERAERFASLLEAKIPFECDEIALGRAFAVPYQHFRAARGARIVKDAAAELIRRGDAAFVLEHLAGRLDLIAAIGDGLPLREFRERNALRHDLHIPSSVQAPHAPEWKRIRELVGSVFNLYQERAAEVALWILALPELPKLRGVSWGKVLAATAAAVNGRENARALRYLENTVPKIRAHTQGAQAEAIPSKPDTPALPKGFPPLLNPFWRAAWEAQAESTSEGRDGYWKRQHLYNHLVGFGDDGNRESSWESFRTLCYKRTYWDKKGHGNATVYRMKKK